MSNASFCCILILQLQLDGYVYAYVIVDIAMAY